MFTVALLVMLLIAPALSFALLWLFLALRCEMEARATRIGPRIHEIHTP